MSAWKDYEIEFLRVHYPHYGREYCAGMLQRSVDQIRAKTHRLGLKKLPDSFHTSQWQARAAQSKVGKKRPEQSKVMRRLHADGKLLKTPAQRAAVGERMKLWIAEHGHPKGASGMKHSQSAINKISAASKSAWEKMTDEKLTARTKKQLETKIKNGTYVRERHKTTWKSGWREIGGLRVYYRSRWEANYARYLEWLKANKQIVKWEHEPETFWFEGIKRGCVSYLPDFKVYELDGRIAYHEVKGWMDDRSKTKIKRMAKYHPSVKLVVIDSKAYRSIAKTMQAIINDWE